MPFEKGRAKTGGRQKGTPNAHTAELRQVMHKFCSKSLECIMLEYEQLTLDKKIDVMIKLLPYIVARPVLEFPPVTFASPSWIMNDNKLTGLKIGNQ
jgi:hypothetical protein